MALRQNALAILAGLAALGIASVFFFNNVVSTKVVSGSYLRWTIWQNYSNGNPAAVYVYVDLKDGRTIMARAPANWIPPGIGTDVTVEERTLLLGGSSYVIK
jgi:hypothetical protein